MRWGELGGGCGGGMHQGSGAGDGERVWGPVCDGCVFFDGKES